MSARRVFKHRCPRCQAEVVTYVPAEVFHRCAGSSSRAALTRYELVAKPSVMPQRRLRSVD